MVPLERAPSTDVRPATPQKFLSEAWISCFGSVPRLQCKSKLPEFGEEENKERGPWVSARVATADSLSPIRDGIGAADVAPKGAPTIR
jgi:hypothetical protein